MEEDNLTNSGSSQNNNSPKQIAGAIIIAGIIIAGAILLKGSSAPATPPVKLANAKVFNQCIDSDKFAAAVADSKDGGVKAGVNGTPKGFILRNGEIVATIDGAEPTAMVK